jgi:hypothetical protein
MEADRNRRRKEGVGVNAKKARADFPREGKRRITTARPVPSREAKTAYNDNERLEAVANAFLVDAF